MNPEEELRAIDEELAKRSSMEGSQQNASSELDLINAELAKRGVSDDYSKFSGERTWGRAGARSAKSLAAGAIGGIPDMVASVYNIPAALTNAQKKTFKDVDPRILAMGEAMGGMPAPIPGQADLPLIPSAVEAIDKGIDTATQGYTATPEDQKYIQDGLKVAGSLGGGAAWAKLVETVGAKGISEIFKALSSTKPSNLAGGFVAGATASKLESDYEYGKVPSIIAGTVAGGLTGAGLRSNLYQNVKGKVTGYSPKNINLEAVQAAEKAGLDYPSTLVNESKPIAGIEQLVQRTPILGTKYNRKLQNIDQAYGEKVKDSIKSVGDKISESTEQADMLHEIGSSLKGTLEKTRDLVKQEKDVLYNTANELLPETASIVPNNTIKAINEIRSSIKTLRPSTDEKFLLSYLDDIEKGIVFKNGELQTSIPVPIKMLSGTKRSLNDTINWDVNAGGVKNNLKKIQGSIKEDLADYGKQNKEWYKAYTDADSYYGKYLGDEALASDTVKKIFSQEDPERILLGLKDVSDFKKIENSLGSTQEGKQFFNSLKREKLENMILGKTIDPKTNEVSYSSFAKLIEDPKNSTLIKYLAGDFSYSKLKDLSKYAQAMVKRQRRNPNPSGTAYTNTMLGVVTGAMMGGGGIFSTITNAGKVVAIGGALSRVVTSKKLLNYAVNAAKAQANGDSQSALKWGSKLDKSFAEEFGESALREIAQLTSRSMNNENK